MLYTVLAAALVVAGLDYMEQQKSQQTAQALDEAMEAAKGEPISLKMAEELIVGSPKREEDGAAIKLTWGVIRDHKVTLVTSNIVGGKEVMSYRTGD